MNRTASPNSPIIAAVNSCSAAQSLRSSVANASPSRQLITASPCSPNGPDSTTASPGSIRSNPSDAPGNIAPTPEVLMTIPSSAPRGRTFVSPVTISTPASRAARPAEANTRSSSAIWSPSCSTSDRLSATGLAPLTARSLIVPQTASLPMSPPGNSSGWTM